MKKSKDNTYYKIKKMLSEGAWGYLPRDCDSYLDSTHTLLEPVFKQIIEKLNDETLDVYPWLGLANDMFRLGDVLVELGDEIIEMHKAAMRAFHRMNKDSIAASWKKPEEYKKELGKLMRDMTDNVIKHLEERPNEKNKQYLESLTKMTVLERRNKVVKNDNGEIVPDTCPECGAKVGLYIHGEPVYLCSKCNKYFGTMPCNLNEKKTVFLTEEQLKKLFWMQVI